MDKAQLLRAIFDKDNMLDREPKDEDIDRVLSTLSPIERFVIEQYFMTEDMTLDKVGKIYPRHDGGIGVTRERVRKIKDRALRKLRHPARKNLLKWADKPST
jgi:RNA polymerase primary sigma factor